MTSDIPDYDLATNKAYEVLLKLHISSLPVDVQTILNNFSNVKLVTYTAFCKRFSISKSDFFAMGVSSYGFTFRKPHDSIVLYDDCQDECIIRFTLAHELGHLYLLHMKEDQKSNREANCFARNFLCPIPVVNSWGLNSVEDYVDIFNVSPPNGRGIVEYEVNRFISYYWTEL